MRIYTADPAVVALAAPGLALGAWILVVDASQGILTGALRGAADIWAALVIQLVSFWLICIPACYLLGHALGYGVRGAALGPVPRPRDRRRCCWSPASGCSRRAPSGRSEPPCRPRDRR